MSDTFDFKNKKLKEIRLWAWAAAVLPITALSGIFFIWVFGTKTLFDIAIVVGETTMFGIAVVWWWWALYTIKKVIEMWDEANKTVNIVIHDVHEVTEIIKETILSEDDK